MRRNSLARSPREIRAVHVAGRHSPAGSWRPSIARARVDLSKSRERASAYEGASQGRRPVGAYMRVPVLRREDSADRDRRSYRAAAPRTTCQGYEDRIVSSSASSRWSSSRDRCTPFPVDSAVCVDPVFTPISFVQCCYGCRGVEGGASGRGWT